MYKGLPDYLCGLGQKFQNNFCYTVYFHMAQLLTMRLPGFSAGWRNGLPLSSNLIKILVSVRMTNFDPNEPSTKGRLIGNEASQKLGFGDSDPPLMI